MLKSEKIQSFGEKLRGRTGNIVVDQEEKKSFHFISNLKSDNFFGFLYKDSIFIKKEEQFFVSFILDLTFSGQSSSNPEFMKYYYLLNNSDIIK